MTAQLPSSPNYVAFLSTLAQREADLRMQDVVSHQIRVAGHATALAERVGISGRDLRLFSQAVRFHDIGKLMIPGDILRKPGRLTPDERAVMETHADVGADILARYPGMPPVFETVARYHHERWDGRGYHGLAGDSIPIEARLCAIADVFDALISPRDYKAGMPEHEALSLMTRNVDPPQVGREAFDPDLLREFVLMRMESPSFFAPEAQRVEFTDFLFRPEPSLPSYAP